MKTFIILTLFCSSLYAADVTNTYPNWIVGGDTNDTLVTLTATNGFGIQFALTEDESFFDNWDTPAPPHLRPISVARREVPIYTVVVFAGAGLRKEGTAAVTFDAIARKPDGSIYGEQKDIIGAQGVIDPSPKVLHLVQQYFAIRIEPKDPAGTYTVEVIVTDHVKKLQLRAVRKFTVEK
jgi:hypothetical protein